MGFSLQCKGKIMVDCSGLIALSGRLPNGLSHKGDCALFVLNENGSPQVCLFFIFSSNNIDKLQTVWIELYTHKQICFYMYSMSDPFMFFNRLSL
jgi:hypothetical protein